MSRKPTAAQLARQSEMIGKRFGLFVVVGKSDREVPSGGRPYYLCRCDCGNEREVQGQALRNGSMKSCGCRKVKHGMRHDPLYGVWQSMINRCHNPRVGRYPDYGGRGIRVCDRWRQSFGAFIEDMGPRPSARHQIDRIDNAGDYGPGNCRWATSSEQNRNRRSNHVLEFRGERRTMVEWAEATGIDLKTIHARLRQGWSTEDALTRPVRGRSARP